MRAWDAPVLGEAPLVSSTVSTSFRCGSMSGKKHPVVDLYSSIRSKPYTLSRMRLKKSPKLRSKVAFRVAEELAVATRILQSLNRYHHSGPGFRVCA